MSSDHSEATLKNKQQESKSSEKINQLKMNESIKDSV